MGPVIAIKPTFVVWVGLLAVSGYGITALAAILCTALLSLLPLGLIGPSIYHQWFQVLSVDTGLALALNGSLPGLVARMGLPMLGYFVSAGLLVTITVWVWREQPPVTTVSALAIVTLLIVSPLTWPGYTLFLLPTFFERPWTLNLRIAAGLLVTPVLVVIILSEVNQLTYILTSTIYLCALLLVLFDLIFNKPLRDAGDILITEQPMRTMPGTS
jgi:alpha-1,2-mannosyltransferase/arabinofuranan 3-O-arabinosyltransferase